MLFLILEAIRLHFLNHDATHQLRGSGSDSDSSDSEAGAGARKLGASPLPAARSELLRWFRAFAYPHKERQALTLREYVVRGPPAPSAPPVHG